MQRHSEDYGKAFDVTGPARIYLGFRAEIQYLWDEVTEFKNKDK